MSKRILVTSTDLMMVQFLVPHVINLSENGFQVEIACSDVGGRMNEIREKLDGYVEKIHVVRLVRSPASPTNLKGYQDMKKVINQGNYDIVWTNEPVMGVVTRLAARNARRKGTKVLYMVHGFHFFKGGPKKYWLAFYPVEKAMGRNCDCVVTVNHEDYNRARKMHLPNVKYVHGIGINTERLTLGENQNDIRQELGLSSNSILVLSIGELNTNKNQKTIIKALSMIKDQDVHYLLCGKGDQLEALTQLANDLNVSKRVHFLGYRTDVVDICSQSDIYVMPSHREGLPVSSLEAMYCGLPLVTSNIRGLTDVMEDGKSGFLCSPDDSKAFAKSIQILKANKKLREACSKRNKEFVKKYLLQNTKKELFKILEQL